MTLHASKGLEFTHVFIIGVNDGLIPLSGGSVDAKEEEQRLFYACAADTLTATIGFIARLADATRPPASTAGRTGAAASSAAASSPSTIA